MTGRAGTSLVINGISLGVMAVSLAVLLPVYGVVGIGFSLLLTALSNMGGIAFALQRFEGFQTMNRFIFLIIILAILSVVVIAVGAR